MMGDKIKAGFLATILLATAQIGMTQETSAHGGRPEGVKIHGSWTIQLRNPDGTVASTHKFENALVAPGAVALAQILARQSTVKYWQVKILNKDGGLCSRANAHAECGILDRALTPDVSSDYATLTISAPTTGANAGKLVLSGNAPASFDGNISAVNSSVATMCTGNIACQFTWSVFTVAYPTPISVQAGQTMDVTVVFSFS